VYASPAQTQLVMSLNRISNNTNWILMSHIHGYIHSMAYVWYPHVDAWISISTATLKKLTAGYGTLVVCNIGCKLIASSLNLIQNVSWHVLACKWKTCLQIWIMCSVIDTTSHRSVWEVDYSKLSLIHDLFSISCASMKYNMSAFRLLTVDIWMYLFRQSRQQT